MVDENTGTPIFEIEEDTGVIKTAVCCLDREKTPDYSIQVVAMDGGGLKGMAISVKEQEDFDKDGIPNTEDPDTDNDGVRDEWDDDDDNDGIIDSTDRDFDFNYILPKSSSNTDNISSSSRRFFVRAGYFLGQLIVILLL